MSIIDIIVLVIIGVFVAVGIFKGFVKSLFDLLNYVFALVVAILLYKLFARFVCDIFLIDGIALDKHFINQLQTSLEAKGGIFVAAPGGYTSENVAIALSDAGVPVFFATILNPILVSVLSGVTVGLAEALATFIVDTAIYIIAFIVLYIIATIVLHFISGAICKLFQSSSFAVGVDKSLGAVFGLLQGVIIIWLILALVGLISGILPSIQNLIESSVIAKFLQSNNLLVSIITSNFDIGSFFGTQSA